MKFEKPMFQVESLQDGLEWTPSPVYWYEEKMDGVWADAVSGASILVGEQMKDGSFYAFDIPVFNGYDIRDKPLCQRLAILDTFDVLRPEMSYHGGQLLSQVIARGGEGIVRKNLNGSYGFDWTKCKRIETFYCEVTKMGSTQSVEIKDCRTGQKRGNVSLKGGKCDRVRIGSIVKIEGFGLTEKGFIREPRPCKDTPTSWLWAY